MRMKNVFSNNCGCNSVFYEIVIFQIVTLQGKLNRAGAVQISKIWKNFFSKIYLYTLCDIPPNDLGLITQKCIFWISLISIYLIRGFNDLSEDAMTYQKTWQPIRGHDDQSEDSMTYKMTDTMTNQRICWPMTRGHDDQSEDALTNQRTDTMTL